MVETVDYAKLSLSVYSSSETPVGWTDLRIVLPEGSDESGFFARAFRNASGEIVIAYRGTDDLRDLFLTNPAIALQTPNAQFVQALEFAKAVNDQFGDEDSSITVTGHSLGGFLAQLAADVFDLGGDIFESPGAREMTEGESAAQFAAFFADPANAGLSFDGITAGLRSYRIENSLIPQIGTVIGEQQQPIDAGNGGLNIVALMAGLSVLPAEAALLLFAAKDQLARHSMESLYQQFQRQTEQGLLLQALTKQFMTNGVTGYAKTGRSLGALFASWFDGVPPLSQDEAEGLVATMENLRDNDPRFNDAGNLAIRDDLIKALDEVKKSVQDILSVTVTNNQWSEADGADVLDITINLQYVLERESQVVRVDLPDAAFDLYTGDLNGFIASGLNPVFVDDPFSSTQPPAQQVDYYEFIIGPGQSSGTLTLVALKDADVTDNVLGEFVFTPLGRIESGAEPVAQTLSLTIIDEGALQTTNTITGTNQDDRVVVQGELVGNNLMGGADNDLIDGLRGDDDIRGGGGHDLIYGGVGEDYLIGDEGNDRIYGGVDRDVLMGATGDDQLRGEDQGDFLAGEEGHDLIDGGEGDDLLVGNSESDRLLGGDGNDILHGDSLIHIRRLAGRARRPTRAGGSSRKPMTVFI